MLIQYTVEQEDNRAALTITPSHPINGFFGCRIVVENVPLDQADEFLHERVRWKLGQELGADYLDTGAVTVERI